MVSYHCAVFMAGNRHCGSGAIHPSNLPIPTGVFEIHWNLVASFGHFLHWNHHGLVRHHTEYVLLMPTA